MYIIVAGGGTAGAAIAGQLMDRKHDVVVIDHDRERCAELYAHSGIVTVYGDARDVDVLKDAGIARADAVVAALYRDTDNLTFALLAHSEGVGRIIVRMRDPAYHHAYLMAGVSSVCDMNSMFTGKVLTELESPRIKVITDIERGKAQLIMFELPKSFPADGIRVQDMVKAPAFAKDCVFAGVMDERSEKIVVPRGNDRLYPGSKVFMVVGRDAISRIEKYLEDAEAQS